MSFPESKKEILDELEVYGYEASDDQLRRWRRLGLLPEPVGREAYGQGGGSDVYYPAGTTEWTLELLRLRQEFRRLDTVGWYLWGRGYPVTQFVRDGMASYFEGLDPSEILVPVMQAIPPDRLGAIATMLPEFGIEVGGDSVAGWLTELAARSRAAPDQLLIELRDEAMDAWLRWRSIVGADGIGRSLPPNPYFLWFAIRTDDGPIGRKVEEWLGSGGLDDFFTEFTERYPGAVEAIKKATASDE